MPVDISSRPYDVAEFRHYTPAYFNANIAQKILGAGGLSWQNASGQQSCAMRVSIALAYAGVHWPRVQNSWRLKDTNVYYPSRAGDYPSLLANGESVANAQEVAGRHGVIYFGGNFQNASGHVTLWNGSQCHHNDGYWSQPVKWFWEMI